MKYLNKLRAIIVLLTAINFLSADEVAFTQTYSENIYGNVKQIGNTVIQRNTTYNVDSSDFFISDDYSAYGWDVVNGEVQYTSTNNYNWNYVGDYSANNYTFVEYINAENDNVGIFNSSSSTLTIPPNSEIKFARLYWAGSVHNFNEGYSLESKFQDAKSVKLKVADTDLGNGAGEYIDISIVSDSYAATEGWADLAYTSNNMALSRYSAYKDVTSFIKQIPTNGSSVDISVANVASEEGWTRGYGNYGAWSLVVVYQNNDESLKNISLYTGFDAINDDVGTIDISGFLTPLNGNVDSSISFFASEGEKTTEFGEDYLKVENKAGNLVDVTNNTSYPNAKDNIFDSSITNDEVRNPSIENNMGIDIDTFEIGTDGDESHPQILGNQQTETSLEFSSGGDFYALHNVTFTTELYEPRVCYEQHFYNLDGTKVTDVSYGDEIIVDIYISNQAKDEDTGTVETAQGVTVTTELDSDIFEFVSDSIRIQNVGETEFSYYDDDINSGLGWFNADTNETIFWIGEGAANQSGGEIEEDEDIFTRFNVTVNQYGDITVDNKYYVNYQNALTGEPYPKTPIEKCKDFNSSFSVLQPPTGVFNIVHKNAVLNGEDPLGGDDPKNALYTQIDGKTFAIDLVSLANDKVTLENSNADIILELVDASNIDDTQQSCNSATVLKEFDDYKGDKFFDNEDQKTWNDLNYTKSHRNVRFRVKYMDFDDSDMLGFDCSSSSRDGKIAGVPQCLNSQKIETYFPECNTEICQTNKQAPSRVPTEKAPYVWECYECIMGTFDPICSRDNFAIRPKEFSVAFDAPPASGLPVAAKIYDLHIEALDQGDSNSTGYDQNMSNIDSNTTKYFRPGFAVAVDTNGTLHGDENITATAAFADGFLDDVNLSYSDVGKIDVNFIDEDWAWVDLKDKPVQNSDPNLNNVEVNGTLSGYRWIPAKFVFNTFTMQDHNNSYTYLSNDLNMSAKIQYNISAVNDNNDTTLNYGDRENGLWERNITIEPALQYDGQNAVFNDFNQTDMDFQNGVITADNSDPEVITFNFDRDPNTVQEPFNVILDGSVGFDFNTTIEDTDGVDGNTSSADGNVTFYYANLYAPDVQSDQEVVDAVAYVEVFCENGSYGTSCAGYDLSQESVDRMNWWQFTQHQNGSGKLIRAESSASSVDIEDDGTVSNMNVDLNAQNDINVEYTGGKNHYKTKITIAPDPWLSYHRYIPYNATVADNDQNFFYIQWDLGAGDWAGVGNVKSTVDVNASDNAQQRIDW